MEQWRWIPGYEDEYQISDQGRVKSFKRKKEGYLLKLRKVIYGKYYQVTLNGKPYYCHRVMMETWVGPCPPGEEVLHLNDIGTDNRLENLAFGTRYQNVMSARDNKCHPTAKLTDQEVQTIRLLLQEGVTQVKIAKMFNVGQGLISHIKRGHTHKEI